MAKRIGGSAIRIPAGLMAVWLLALALAAPIHELSHGSVDHDAAAIEQCDFFVHQHQLAHALVPVSPSSPLHSCAPEQSVAAIVVTIHQAVSLYLARAPPMFTPT
ncbi:hypothetical protein [Ferrimonas gelatinilytica]|uniref:Uncharacterized protein n=1 Tax=Ferrimonas gelatinilytica TaxID=1255257 RepID=A0ABP9S556_9GAMM